MNSMNVEYINDGTSETMENTLLVKALLYLSLCHFITIHVICLLKEAASGFVIRGLILVKNRPAGPIFVILLDL